MSKKIKQKEIEWYRENGSYLSRIAFDSTGNVYLIGDWSWNRIVGADRQEFVEEKMKKAGFYTNHNNAIHADTKKRCSCRDIPLMPCSYIVCDVHGKVPCR